MEELGSGLFAVHTDHLEVNGLKSLLALSRFHPIKKEIFLRKLILSKDLVTDTGINLFAANTELTHPQIARLIRFQENNPKIKMNFIIKKNEDLINSFQKPIENDFLRLIKARQGKKSYKKFISSVKRHIESALSEILSSENFLFIIYRVKIASERHEKKSVREFYRHAINVGLISSGILFTKCLLEEKNFSGDELKNVLLLSMIHNLGAVVWSEKIFKKAADKQEAEYIKQRKETPTLLIEADLPYELMSTLQLYYGYFENELDFINKTDKYSTYANILLVADAFCRRESGLFETAAPVDLIIDEMNVKALESGKYNAFRLSRRRSTSRIFSIFT